MLFVVTILESASCISPVRTSREAEEDRPEPLGILPQINRSIQGYASPSPFSFRR